MVLRVLLVAPLWYPVSRDAAGGIETMLAELADGLVDRGHAVTLLATGDSSTRADLVPVVPAGIVAEMSAGIKAEYAYDEQLLLEHVVRLAGAHDVVHSHIGPAAYALGAMPGLARKLLHSQHTPVTPDLCHYAAARPETAWTTVSDFQTRQLVAAGARRCRTIHNGLDLASFPAEPSGPVRPQLGYLGRMEPVKGPHLAIEVARALDVPLVLGGPVVDAAYFDQEVKRRLGDTVSYAGVLDREQKTRLFMQSTCMVLPFTGPEPFGLVAIEAMACGTPVATLAHGALPEIVLPGVNGEIVADPQELPGATRAAMRLDRSAVRAAALDRFSLDRMLDRYVTAYEGLTA